MLRALLLLTALISLPCSAIEYYSAIYPLRAGLIPPFDVSGDVKVTNGEPSKESVIVYKYTFVKLTSNYHEITQTMVDQVRRELENNGKKSAAGGPAKTIDLKVTHLLSKYSFFKWNSKLTFTATLGNGQVITKDVTHGSGELYQDLNGCIAEAAMVFLNDETLHAYLAKTDADPATPVALTTATTPSPPAIPEAPPVK
ncbi:MAG: hypothetical protein KA902_06105 [Arenimonas sp.]|nr:hypothetical protein [Arenimonas sp.]